VALALHDLAADGRRVLLLLAHHRLVDVHGGLDVVAVRSASQALHLNILRLGLVDTRALPGEEFLLVGASDDAVLDLVGLRRGALRLGELLVNAVGLARAVATMLLYLDVRVAHVRAIAFSAAVLRQWVAVLDVNHTWRARLYVLRL